MSRYAKGAPIPESLGAVVDEFKTVQELRLRMQKEVDAVKARESELHEYIVENLSKSEDRGVAGQRYKAIRKDKRVYKPDDWQQLWPWIIEHERSDMVQKRLNEKAVRDYVEETGELPTGVETLLVPQISITKIET